MKTLIYLKKYSLLVSAIFLLVVAFSINQNLNKPLLVLSKQNETWNLNDEIILKFNLGFKRLTSSLMWVSTILESDIEHYNKKDLNSWMFLRFNTISKLEPRFYENYAFGGLYLSIIKDDISGASIIYNKGLGIFPNDYALLRDAAFHFHFEANDYERSYQIYSKLITHPSAPTIVLSSLARLEKDRGNPDAAFNILFSKLGQIKDQNSFLALKIKDYLYAITAEKDLNCLNNKTLPTSTCSYRDFENALYLKKGDTYYASKNWIPFVVKKKPHVK